MANSEPTTALETLGTYITGDEARDAIHLAVVPMVASEKVYPGQHLAADGKPAGTPVGIVDPFLPGPVNVGQHFWLVLYPRTITSLRHAWTHPAFPEAEVIINVEDPKSVSERWLRSFIEGADCPDFNTTMGKASQILDGSNDAWDDDYMHFDGLDAHGEIPAEFWEHAAIYLGKPTRNNPPTYFSCSC